MSPRTQWANIDMSAKELEERCDEIFTRFESMLSDGAADCIQPEAHSAPDVVTESPSATSVSLLPSPVNIFLHAMDGMTSHGNDLVVAEVTDAETVACHGLPETADVQKRSSSVAGEEFKENMPASDNQSTECLQPQPDRSEACSGVTASVAQVNVAEVLNKDQHITELQQQLSIARQVTDEQHSANHNLLTDMISYIAKSGNS